MSIQELRQEAAVLIGIGKKIDGKVYVNGKLFNGDTTSYRNLAAGDQIALTDRMAGMIKANPSIFTPAQVAVADSRVNSPSYNRPLAATSYINVTSELLKTGELQAAMVSGAKSFSLGLNKTLVLALLGGAALYYATHKKS